MRVFRAILAPLSLAAFGLLLFLYTWLGLLLLAFGLADAYGRYRDYRYLTSYFTDKVSDRLGIYHGRSFCGRQMVIAIEPAWREDYHERGYRWYHILPDDFFNAVRRPRFYKNLFLGHTT